MRWSRFVPLALALPVAGAGLLNAEAPALGTALATEAQHADGDFVVFYEFATERARNPPETKQLKVLCQNVVTENGGTYVGSWISFLGVQPGHVLLFALTPERMGTPEEVLTLKVIFTGRKGGLPAPAARPPQGTKEWGYLYDRNGDGKPDYVAYLEGALGVLPDPVPQAFPFPLRGEAGQYGFTRKSLEAWIDAAQLVFRHYADDDFDGHLDAMVAPVPNPAAEMYVKEWAAFRTARAGGAAAEAWTFTNRIVAKKQTLIASSSGFVVPGGAGGAEKTLQTVLTEQDSLLAVVTRELSRCKLGGSALERGALQGMKPGP